MKRTEEGHPSCHALIGLLISFVLLGAFAGATLCGAADRVAQRPPAGWSQPQVPAAVPIDVQFMAAGYSVYGPVQVFTFEPSSFQVWGPRGQLQIPTQNMNLSVVDSHGRGLPQRSLEKGTAVYVCRKARHLVVIVLGQQGGVK